MLLLRFFVDSAYLSSAACEVLQPTAWIPLIDANKINGCMQVIALSILSRLANPSYPLAEYVLENSPKKARALIG